MQTIVDHLTTSFPEFSAELKQGIIRNGKLVHMKAGETLMQIGGDMKTIPLISEGAIKVMREDEEGHELFLYYLRPGQTCALSLNCFLMSRPSEVHAECEDDTTFIALNASQITDWISKFPDWRNFVIGTYQMRFSEMLHTIDGIAFKQLDDRVLEFLREQSVVHDSNLIQMTHQEIAIHLNSSREVISRILKILEKNQKIKLGRNKIELV